MTTEPHPESPDKSHRIGAAVLGVLSLAWLWAMWRFAGPGNYPLDDAYIVDHAVEAIRHGAENRFLDSSPWDGVTSPLYTFLVLGLSYLLPLDLAHWFVQAAGALLFLGGVYAVGCRKGLHAAVCVTLTAIALLSGLTIFHLFNGLETGWAMAAVIWMLIALETPVPPLAAYAVAGILPFLRPELAALSGLAFLALLRRRPEGWKRGTALAFAAFAISALAIVAITGTLVSNTASAKQYFFATGCWETGRKASFMGWMLLDYAMTLGPLSIGFLASPLSRNSRWVAFPFVLTFLCAYFVKFPTGLMFNGWRYLYILVPVAAFGCVQAFALAEEKLKMWKRRHLPTFLVLSAILAHGFYNLGAELDWYGQELSSFANGNRLLAAWIRDNVPPDRRILVHDAGMISTIGSNPLVDMVGLKTRASVALHRDITWKSCVQPKEAAFRIARDFKADYMVATVSWAITFGLLDAFLDEGWELEPLWPANPDDSPYRLFRLVPPPERAGVPSGAMR